jgi:enamine deaminase RidA (YjgF/YER057c/UK114 family)
MITEKLHELGYDYSPANLIIGPFQAAVQVGNLVYTSGQIPLLGDVQIKGKVGTDLTLEEARKAAEICAFNCLRAIGAVTDINSVKRVVKVLGMVNVAEGFNDTSGVINGCSEFLKKIWGENGSHARSAVGMVLPGNWAVEVEMIVELKS